MMKTLFPGIRLLLIVMLAQACQSTVQSRAEDRFSEVTRDEARLAAELAGAEIPKWKFRLLTPAPQDLTLVESPAIRWSNPAVGRVYGSVYLLTADQRPQAIACSYKWFSPFTGFEMECRSLATTQIEAVRDQKSVWRASSPGIEWHPVPGNRAVGASTAERNRQLKQIAALFTASLLDTRANLHGVDQQLRQMTQPVYRYQSPDQGVLDGGVIAFVVGTDPELLLLLEAQQQDEGPRWHYALARMNSDRMAVKFEQQEIWRVDQLSVKRMRDFQQPYFIFEVADK